RPYQREPRRKSRGLRSEQRVDRSRCTPAPAAHFVRGWYGLSVPLPDEQMKVFPLDETVSDIQRVLNGTDAVQRAVESHLLTQTPFGRPRDVLSGTRMTATGVRP